MSDVLRSLARPDALGRLVEREWGVPVEHVTLHRSLANDVYRVDPGHFLKVYRHGWRSPEEVAWECELAGHLAREGVPVPPVVRRADGALSGTWQAPEGPRPLVLLETVEGHRPVPPFAPGLHRAHGRLVARIHAAGESFRPGHRRGGTDLAAVLDAPLAEVLPLLSAADRDRAVSVAAAARAGLAANPPLRGLCHGDATMDNVLITGGTEEEPELVVFDFDLAGEGFLIADFPFGSPNWGHFVAGYTEIRPVDRAGLAAEAWLDAIEVIAGLRFHLITKPAWRGAESQAEGWLDQALGDLRALAG
ncbi:phosphotransferase enzyme family protein [Longispora albida]|uniref:phosphotransferase enzyme family protein n=1 Tax=Longispora albida TaxID=203523 RepID=UPI00037FF2DF|nr:phosphotransferase [Longispora albida]